ncbi:hypothetical protein BH10PSE1_BH10PSE1_21340 [soil metagenome]
MIKFLATFGLIAMTAACASDPGPGPVRGPDGPPMAIGPQLFVSPFGETFKSDPGQPYPSAAWFAQADVSADGRLDRDEFQADGRRVFVALDLDGDGVIGPVENAAYERTMAQTFMGQGPRGGPGGGGGRGGRGRGSGGPGGEGGPRAGLAEGQQDDAGSYILPRGQRHGDPAGPVVSALSMANLLNVPQPVKAADVDTNQRITPQEWANVGDRWFALLDTNKDGVLTMAELPQTALQQRGERRR